MFEYFKSSPESIDINVLLKDLKEGKVPLPNLKYIADPNEQKTSGYREYMKSSLNKEAKMTLQERSQQWKKLDENSRAYYISLAESLNMNKIDKKTKKFQAPKSPYLQFRDDYENEIKAELQKRGETFEKNKITMKLKEKWNEPIIRGFYERKHALQTLEALKPPEEADTSIKSIVFSGG